MAIINPDTRRMRKIMQELIDNGFLYLKMHNDGTPFQKKVAKRKLTRSLEDVHEYLNGTGKLIKLKPPKDIVSYTTGAKTVHIINKPDR